MDFYNQLLLIKERPGMWIGDVTLSNIQKFSDGISFCMENNNIKDDFVLVYYKYFNWYVNYRLLHMNLDDETYDDLKFNGSRSFVQLIPLVETDLKKQVALFYIFLEEFYEAFCKNIDFEKLIIM